MNNDILKVTARNRDDVANDLKNAYNEENKFVVIKEGGKPVVLIGKAGQRHARIVLEYLDQNHITSVIVAGGGACKMHGYTCAFYGESKNLKSPKNSDIEEALAPVHTTMFIETKCFGDAVDTEYTHDSIRRIAF